MSSQPKRSLAAGISCLAEAGALFAGDVAGLEVTLHEPARLRDETRGAELVWDDAEERRYRDWVKEKVQQSQEADFEELREEETFRSKLREETEKRKTVEVRWEDEREKQWRAEYQRWRLGGAVVWDTSGEREAQQSSRRETKLRRNTELRWEDGEERACREMYRKKYGK